MPNRLTTPRTACLVGALGAMLIILAVAVAPAHAKTTVFTFKKAEQTFKVPAGVTSLEILAIGGGGGDTPAAAHGGEAAEVTGIVNVTPGQTLYVEVGGNGKDADLGGTGGFNGGGDGGGNGEASGGGGASDVRTSPRAAGLAPDTRLIIAAGGGGAGGLGTEVPGDGGDAEKPGENGGSSEKEGGGAGTQIEGGAGGGGCNEPGEDGIRGIGGEGGAAEIRGPGGGGGGGFFGGGRRRSRMHIRRRRRGRRLLSHSRRWEAQIASCCIEPQVQIIVAPVISIASPGDGATYTQGQVVNASYSCTPAEGATVKTCAGTVANGAPIDTSTPGSHSFTVNTEDEEGAKGSKTVSYTVVAPNASRAQHIAEIDEDRETQGDLQVRLERGGLDLPLQARQEGVRQVQVAQDLQEPEAR